MFTNIFFSTFPFFFFQTQLRARHAIPSNSANFGEKSDGVSGGSPIITLLAAIIVIVIVFVLVNKDTLLG
jgi:hypothetical protein